jgi:ProP effector
MPDMVCAIVEPGDDTRLAESPREASMTKRWRDNRAPMSVTSPPENDQPATSPAVPSEDAQIDVEAAEVTAPPADPAAAAAIGAPGESGTGAQSPDSATAASEAGAPDAPSPAAARDTALDSSPALCAEKLAELFPALFVNPPSPAHATPAAAGAQPTPVKPIKLRIHADIQARAPGVFSKRALGIFFSRYTTTNAYLKALAHAPHRFDLDGQPAGEIADEHRRAAFEELARRRAIAIEKRAGVRRGPPRQRHDAPRAGQGVGQQNETAPPGENVPPPAEGPLEGGQTPTHRDGTAGHDNRREGPRAARADAHHRGQPSGPSARPARDRPRDARSAPGAPHHAGTPQHTRPDPRPSSPGGAPPQRDGRPAMPNPRDRDARQGPHRHGGHHDPRRDHGNAHDAPLPQDPAQRERALLLRAFEGSPLSKANFCALKRMSESDLDAQLDLARKDRDATRRSEGHGPER